MNTDTLNLIERPYLEIVDDLLTAIVGGIVNEPIIFDLKADLYRLSQPARDVRSVTGTIAAEGHPNGVRHTFLKEVDFLFNVDRGAVVWQDGGQKPKDETTFYVDYFVPASRSPLTDINVGSVTRTLSEAIGREIATVYQQINLTYLSGFIDTAQGKALDFVVSILGVTRKTKEFAVGAATFFRDPTIEGNITIPQATELSTTKGEVTFETIEPRTLQRGQARIDAPIRAGNKFKGDAGKVESGKITNISQVIAGISRVTNFDPTILAAEDESDADLRLRAKAAIHGVGKATILALRKAVFDSRGTLKEIADPNTGVNQTPPGTVTMLVETEPARFPGVVAAVNDTRAAGVQVTIMARFVFVKPRIIAKIPAGTTAAGKAKFANEIITAIQQHFEKLEAETPADGKALIAAIKTVKGVDDPKIVDVRTSRADIGKPGTNAVVEALVARLSTVNPSDPDALRSAVTEIVNSETPALMPQGSVDPDRSLVQGSDPAGRPSGQRAKDGEIETGKFVIMPPPQFSLILDMEPADIAFVEV